MNVLKIITILLSNKYEILIKLFELTPSMLSQPSCHVCCIQPTPWPTPGPMRFQSSFMANIGPSNLEWGQKFRVLAANGGVYLRPMRGSRDPTLPLTTAAPP